MRHNSFYTNCVLVFVSLIWGLGFVPQRLGLDTLEPMGFNAFRFLFGATILLPIFYFVPNKRRFLRSTQTIKQSLVLGVLLAGGAGFQQVSLGLTPIANVAFITGFYVIFVPIIGLALGYRYKALTWLGGLLALAGLALLSGFQGRLSLNGDMVALIGAIFWALHLMAITRFVKSSDAYVLAFYQFLFCASVSALFNFRFESHFLPSDQAGYIWAALNGIVVVGVAYTLQVAVLKHADPFVASIIFSLEAVFGAIAGYWFFSEVMGASGLLGALLMFVGCLLAQLPNKPVENTNNAVNRADNTVGHSDRQSD